jgi:hypothetical protein
VSTGNDESVSILNKIENKLGNISEERKNYLVNGHSRALTIRVNYES